jgi:hypothetical protein
MKERPILFSAEMVRAVLEPRKTQTRRIIKPQFDKLIQKGTHGAHIAIEVQPGYGFIKCPYGKPGDRLWVREAWHTYKCLDHQPPRMTGTKSAFWYSADNGTKNMFGAKAEIKGKKRPSIHMPRWASRINLEIIDIRVERVQDISHEDAISEGVSFLNNRCTIIKPCRDRHQLTAMQHAFYYIWELLHGPDAWERNDWVWVVEFKSVD